MTADSGYPVPRDHPEDHPFGFARLAVSRRDLSSGLAGEDAGARILLLDAAGRTRAELSLADESRESDHGWELDGPVR